MPATMSMPHRLATVAVVALVVIPGATGCLVFDKELHDQVTAKECATHRECTERMSGDAGATVAAVCVQPEGKCQPLLSEDCTAITGDHLNDRAIFIGSLFSTKGSQAATNLARQESAALAVEQINATGGIPAAAGAPRPLVMISCDESTMLLRAGRHLITDLHVPGIIGPNTSQDTIDLTIQLSAAAGTALLTPTGVASSIANLQDNGLTFQMVPNDKQRGPLMIQQINDLESQLKTQRMKPTLKLGIVYRDDALGVGTRTALNPLVFNGKPLTDPINLGQNVRIDAYDFTLPDQNALVTTYLTFLPDLVVVVGTAEVVTAVMKPLEEQWPTGTPRPLYVGIDSIRVPDLLTVVTGNDDLRHRIRGTGVTTGADTTALFTAFKIDYSARYPGKPATISGMGPSYDAAYAMAYALAATRDQPVSGASIVAGLLRLKGGSTVTPVGSTNILAAFLALAQEPNIAAIGTFGAFDWDAVGAKTVGALEMWCINATGAAPSFQPSGLTYDVASNTYAGSYVQCAP